MTTAYTQGSRTRTHSYSRRYAFCKPTEQYGSCVLHTYFHCSARTAAWSRRTERKRDEWETRYLCSAVWSHPFIPPLQVTAAGFIGDVWYATRACVCMASSVISPECTGLRRSAIQILVNAPIHTRKICLAYILCFAFASLALGCVCACMRESRIYSTCGSMACVGSPGDACVCVCVAAAMFDTSLYLARIHVRVTSTNSYWLCVCESGFLARR